MSEEYLDTIIDALCAQKPQLFFLIQFTVFKLQLAPKCRQQFLVDLVLYNSITFFLATTKLYIVSAPQLGTNAMYVIKN